MLKCILKYMYFKEACKIFVLFYELIQGSLNHKNNNNKTVKTTL